MGISTPDMSIWGSETRGAEGKMGAGAGAEGYADYQDAQLVGLSADRLAGPLGIRECVPSLSHVLYCIVGGAMDICRSKSTRCWVLRVLPSESCTSVPAVRPFTRAATAVPKRTPTLNG